MQQRATLTGILAGIGAGLLTLAITGAGPFAVFLMFIATGAIYVASLGWGRQGAVASVLAATATLAIFSDFTVALAALAFQFLPAGWVSYLANLGHSPDGGKTVTWYPIGRILFHLMALLSAVFIAAGIATGMTTEVLVESFRELFARLAEMQSNFAIPPEVVEQQARIYAQVVPFAAPAVWLIMHVITAYAATSITARSGNLPRSDREFASGSALPMEAALLLAAGMIAMLVFDGGIALAGAVITGVGVTGFAMSGLAMLHMRLRGNPAATLILIIVYGSIIVVGIPLFAFTVAGLWRTFTPASPPPPGGKTNTST